MPRPLRIFQNEYPYHVVTRTNEHVFKFRPTTYKLFITILNDISKKYHAKVQHFQLMSNHYHMKIFTPKQNLNRIMHYFNGEIAKRLNRLTGVKGHLWERRYHCSIISTDRYAQICIAYIYNNVVRAGLCKTASESDFLSSYTFYAKGKKIDFIINEDEVYLMLSKDESERRKRFKEMVEIQLSPQETEMVRGMLRGLFVGSADFIKQMRVKYSDRLRLNRLN